MALASEILARAHESMKGCFPELKDRELVGQFLSVDKELGLLESLRNLNASGKAETKNKNTILIFKDGEPLQMEAYRDATDALRALFHLENEHPEWDVVLVRAESSDEVRIAFKNYFSDARDFIKLVDAGCTKLTKTKNIKDDYKPRAHIIKVTSPSRGPKPHKKWWLK